MAIRAESDAFVLQEELDALETELSVAQKHLSSLTTGDVSMDKQVSKLEAELEQHMKVADADVLQRVFCSVTDTVVADKLRFV